MKDKANKYLILRAFKPAFFAKKPLQSACLQPICKSGSPVLCVMIEDRILPLEGDRHDGQKKDYEKAGIFMLCMGGYMAGSSVSKIFGDRAENRIYDRMDRMGMSDNEYRRRRKKNGNVYVGPPPGDYGVDDGIGEDEEVLDP